MNAIWADQCSSNVSLPYGDLFGLPAIPMVYHLSRQCHHFFSYSKEAFEEALHSTLMTVGGWIEVATC